jgi:hypothetical protein
MPAGIDRALSKAIGPAAADNTSVRTDTGQMQDGEQGPELDFAYTPEERSAIDAANEAFAPVIKAVDTFEDIQAWVPPLVRGVRALRDRAKRETRARNYFNHEYRKKFGVLLRAEPIGPWLLAKHRHSLLDAIQYLGSDDAYLDTFMEWRATTITEEQRKKWRTLRVLVDHFKEWQTGTPTDKDERPRDQKEDTAQYQLAKLQEIANRETATQRKGRKKAKATQQAASKSSASGKPADTTSLPTADSPAPAPEAVSQNETAAEIERLKADLAEKTESLRQIEDEVRQARLAASRASECAVTSPSSVPTHGDDDLDIPPFLDRRPLSAEEEKALAALDAAWSNAPAIVQERFRATRLRTVKNVQDPAQT